MLSIQVFHSTDELPAAYECQIRAYVRILWNDSYVHDLDAPLVPPERHPHFVVLGERHALFSAARVSWVMVEHAGHQLKMYCLGDVFTYPAFRNRGYGRQVVDAATELIRSDPEADAAILFTEPDLENFYAQSGWQHVAGLSATIGDPDYPEPNPGFAMMQFLSDRTEKMQGTFETRPLFLPGFGW